MEDLYSTLNCDMTSSSKVIKESYQKLLLKHHPDKCHDVEEEAMMLNIQLFQKIQQAYKILGDADKRKEYDARWKQCMLTRDWPVQDNVNISDFEMEDNVYFTNCRCGGEYCLSADDVEFNFDYIQCSNCSLCIRVLYDKPEVVACDSQNPT